MVKLMLPSSRWTFGCRALHPIKELAFGYYLGIEGQENQAEKKTFQGKLLNLSDSQFLPFSFPPLFLLQIFLYLTALVLVVAHRIFYLHRVGSSSLTRG